MFERSRTWKKLTVAALAVGLMSGAAVSASTPAMATTKDCPKGFACAWDDAGWTGTYVKFKVSIKNFESLKMHDKASSVYNNGRTNSARFYKNENYKGKSFALAKGKKDGNLRNSVGAVPGGFNDSIDSARFV